MKILYLPFLLILFALQLKSQNTTFISLPVDFKDAAQKATERASACNFAGTFSLGPFAGQSNDFGLDTIYLCLGDSILIQHNGDFDLSGDPVPATPPGIGWAFYDCPPSIDGPDLSSILQDNCLTPGAATGMWVYSRDDVPSGTLWFYNSGQLQNIFAAGDPLLLNFAPITLDALSPAGFESSAAGAPGPCVNVNTDAAFQVVYLNKIQQAGVTNFFGNNCIGKFRLEGGLPQWNASELFSVDVALDTNSAVKGNVFTSAYQMFNGGDIIFSVHQPGQYVIRVEDGKSCGQEFKINMSGCVPDHPPTLSLPQNTGHAGSIQCMPITVQNFNVASGSFSVSWDPEVLEFADYASVNPALGPGFNPNNFNFSNLYQGKLGITFFNTASPGAPVVIPDGETLLSLCFNVLKEPAPCTDVLLDNSLTGISFESAQGNLLPVNFSPGAVCGVLMAVEPGNQAELKLQPGIVRAGSDVMLELSGASFAPGAQISIVDLAGRVLKSRTIRSANNVEKIDTMGLAPGLYVLDLALPGIRFAKKLMVVQGE